MMIIMEGMGCGVISSKWMGCMGVVGAPEAWRKRVAIDQKGNGLDVHIGSYRGERHSGVGAM